MRSKDWKPIVMPRGLDPDSPAFTYSAKRETFIEEALVADVSGRKEELNARWHLRADELRELVIAHELPGMHSAATGVKGSCQSTGGDDFETETLCLARSTTMPFSTTISADEPEPSAESNAVFMLLGRPAMLDQIPHYVPFDFGPSAACE